MNTDEIITLEQLVKLDRRLAVANEEVADLDIALTQMLKIHTELKVGMKLIVTEEARKHLGGAHWVKVGDPATIKTIWVSVNEVINVTIDYGDRDSNVQSLERAQAMRNAYLKSLEDTTK